MILILKPVRMRRGVGGYLFSCVSLYIFYFDYVPERGVGVVLREDGEVAAVPPPQGGRGVHRTVVSGGSDHWHIDRYTCIGIDGKIR